jgi:glucose dehydrogenase
MRYSPLTQITRSNVTRLQVAWSFHTQDVQPGDAQTRRSGFESTPLVVDGTLYVTTPFNRIIALDPDTGRERWTYDPRIDLHADYGDGLINRGLATWLDRTASAKEPCRRRLVEATLDARLVAIDAASGLPCQSFGERGAVSLRGVAGFEQGAYHMTSPPVVVDDVVVIDLDRGTIRWQVPLGSLQPLVGSEPRVPPGSVSLGGSIVTASGLVFIAGTIDPYLRAFDIETGRELWKGELPAAGHATPITYQLRSGGKQYVVVAAGGHAKISEERLGDALIAFALGR